MKKSRKMFTSILAVLLLMSTASGCFAKPPEGDSVEQIDTSKAQLNIGHHLTGYGEDWLLETKRLFEDYYKDTKFGDKVGVQVMIQNEDSAFGEGAIKSSLSTFKNDIYYLHQVSQPELFVKSNLFMDITSWVTENIYDENGNLAADTGKTATQSIVDTMYDDYAAAFNFGTTEAPKYYHLPWRLGVGGIIYDADLFNEKELFLLDDNGTIGGTYADIEAGNCSKGPDGELGTEDDGLPNTWEQFKKLLKTMADSEHNVTPFTWSSATNYQRREMLNYIAANYEGENDWRLNYSFSGTDSEFGEINGNDKASYNKLRGQQGKKAAIQAAYDIINGNYYSNRVINNNHLGAESEFVQSGTQGANPVAMLFEGGWWEIEAKPYFAEAAKVDSSYAYGNRNYKVLPTPNFVGTEGIADKEFSERILTASGATTTEFVWADSPNKDLAKLWVQFTHSRECLSLFTKETSAFRPYDFVPTTEEKAAYTKYTQSIYALIEEGAIVISDLDTATAKKASPGTYNESNWDTSLAIGTKVYTDALQAFRTDSTLTVAKAFQGMKDRIIG